MKTAGQKRDDGYMAFATAPTPTRRHRSVRGFGDTEAAALIDLAARLVELGAAQTGEAEVVHMTAENRA